MIPSRDADNFPFPNSVQLSDLLSIIKEEDLRG